MQVHCDEGIANHIGPEPCAGHREVSGEASVGERAGQPLSRDSYVHPGCRLGLERGRQHGGAREREHPCDTAWSKTLARMDALCTGTGRSLVRPVAAPTGPHREADARRFWDAMRLRLEEFSLALHPDKTRLLEFGRYAAVNRQSRGLGRPETFAFLGFIFICGRSRRGSFQLQRKTRGDRMRAKLRQIKGELRRRWHEPIPVQGKWLGQVVRGYFAYHAVPTNSRALSAFRYHVVDLWRRALRRRSQKDHMTWKRIERIADAWLPQPRILHPWPDRRFAVKHPR